MRSRRAWKTTREVTQQTRTLPLTAHTPTSTATEAPDREHARRTHIHYIRL